MYRWLLLGLLGAATPALACSQLPAFGVFVAQNDKNQDYQLSKKEFLQAKVDGNLRIQFKLNHRGFRKLDKNRDGFISWDEPNGNLMVSYKRAPCADWEERVNQMPLDERPAQ